jgi:hypothetical protein
MGSVVVVCGGGVVLCVAMMLARDGHEVTVLETDPDGAPATPAEAWASWRRTGVAQFHQPHIPFPRFRGSARRSCPGCWTGLRPPAGRGWTCWRRHSRSVTDGDGVSRRGSVTSPTSTAGSVGATVGLPPRGAGHLLTVLSVTEHHHAPQPCAHGPCRPPDTDFAPVGSAVRDTAGVEVAVLVERQQRHP